jgi:Glycosyl transferase family 2
MPASEQTTASRHAWRLAELPHTVSTDPYDRRVDDPAIRAARAGDAFFARHMLGLPAADAAPAAEALALRECRLAPRSAAPDVSIVIPVYGQIAYTLNCLDSLFAHVSRYSAEIIVIDDCSPDGSGALLGLLPQIRYQLQPRNGGFVASCNDGAALARGRFVLMLNNDTRVVDGWLDHDGTGVRHSRCDDVGGHRGQRRAAGRTCARCR